MLLQDAGLVIGMNRIAEQSQLGYDRSRSVWIVLKTFGVESRNAVDASEIHLAR